VIRHDEGYHHPTSPDDDDDDVYIIHATLTASMMHDVVVLWPWSSRDLWWRHCTMSPNNRLHCQ